MTENINEEDYVPVSPELILAAILKSMGKVTIPVESLTRTYDNHQIKVDQDQEDFITLELVEVTND
jgi:hypothetical protein